MANKKITDFPKVDILNDDSIFLLNQSNTTSTTYLSTVANTVATKIQNNNSYIPKPIDSANNNGKILTYQYSTQTWIASSAPVSTGGTGGTVDLTGLIPKPTNPSNQQILTYNQSTTTWVASALSSLGSNLYIAKPTATPTNGQALVYSNNVWSVSTLNFIQKPTTVSNNQFLHFTTTSGWGVSSLPDYVIKPASPGAGQALCWNNTTKTWVASSIPAVPTDYIPQPAGSIANEVLFYDAVGGKTVVNSKNIDDSLLTAGSSFGKLFSNQFTGNTDGYRGYQKLPGGLVMQFGYVSTPEVDGSGLVDFEFIYPNRILSVVATNLTTEASVTPNIITLDFQTYNISGITKGKKFAYYNAPVGGFSWIAFGY